MTFTEIIVVCYAVPGLFGMHGAIGLLMEFWRDCSLWLRLMCIAHVVITCWGITIAVNALARAAS